jgi:major capsid protein E
MADETGQGPAPAATLPAPDPFAIVPNVGLETGVFSTLTILDGLRIRWVVPSFIRDQFFGAREFIDSDVVQVDTYRGGRGLAPFILPLEGQVVGRRRPFTRSYVEAPIIAPARTITLREARKPGWGETPYNYKSPEERVASLIAQDTIDMDDEIARTEEFMCASCMFTGQIPISYRTKTNVVIDYGFTNSTTLAKYWTDPTADPLQDLRLAQQALNANGYSGDLAIYSPDAWNALMTNQKVIDQMKYALQTMTPLTTVAIGETPTSGVLPAPSFTNPMMRNFIYSGTYTKMTGATGATLTAVPYVPKGYVLVGSSNVKHRMVYAQVTQIEQSDGQFHSYNLDRVPKIECNVNRNFYMYTITSRPVPVPLDLLSWQILKGTVA